MNLENVDIYLVSLITLQYFLVNIEKLQIFVSLVLRLHNPGKYNICEDYSAFKLYALNVDRSRRRYSDALSFTVPYTRAK